MIRRTEFERRTGWELKPQGACRGDVCIRLSYVPGDEVELVELAQELRMPLVQDSGLWALGPQPGPVIDSALAPDFTLPDRRGGDFTLSSLRGRKAMVVAWAPW